MRSKGKSKVKRSAGRPPTGFEGEKSSQYKRLALRLPNDALATLDAISRAVNLPQWHVVADALAAFLGEGKGLSAYDRENARRLLGRKT